MRKLLPILKPLQYLVVRLFGFTLRESVSGEPLGKFLIIPWRGQIHFIGLDTSHARPFYPVFLPQGRVTYWRQTLGFRSYPVPDYLNERHSDDSADPSNTDSGATDG
jgi:hypothetical protein